MDGFVQCFIQEKLEEYGTYRFVAEIPIPINLIKSSKPDDESGYSILELDSPAIIAGGYVVKALFPESEIRID